MKEHLRQLAGNTVVYGAGTVVTRFIGLLLLPLFTKYLRPDEYGVLAMLGVLTMIAQPIFSLGITAAMGPSYFETERPEVRAQTIWTAFALLAVTSTALLVCSWLMPETLARVVLLPATDAHLVSLALTGCALSLVTAPLTQWVQFEQRARQFVAISVAAAVGVSVLSVVTIAYLGWGAEGMVLSQLAGSAFTLIAFLAAALKQTRPQWSRRISGDLLRLGIRLMPSAGFLFVLMHVNKYFLQWETGFEQTGIYAVGFNIAGVVGLVVSSIATSWYPFFMSFMQKRDEAEIVFGRVFTYYVLGVGYLSLLFFIFAKPVVMTMAQARYWDAHHVIGLVGLAHFFTGVFNLLLPGMYFSKEVSRVTAIQAAAAAVSVAINYVTVVCLGLVGAALGVALSHLALAAFVHLWNVHRRAKYPAIRYEWRRLRWFAVGAIAIAALTQGDIAASLAMELGKSASLAVLATIVLYLALTGEEKVALKSRWIAAWQWR